MGRSDKVYKKNPLWHLHDGHPKKRSQLLKSHLKKAPKKTRDPIARKSSKRGR